MSCVQFTSGYAEQAHLHSDPHMLAFDDLASPYDTHGNVFNFEIYHISAIVTTASSCVPQRRQHLQSRRCKHQQLTNGILSQRLDVPRRHPMLQLRRS
jgi:hypothetical protein